MLREVSGKFAENSGKIWLPGEASVKKFSCVNFYVDIFHFLTIFEIFCILLVFLFVFLSTSSTKFPGVGLLAGVAAHKATTRQARRSAAAADLEAELEDELRMYTETELEIGKFSAKCCSFSAVSAPIFARKYALCSIFQNLQHYQAEIFEI